MAWLPLTGTIRIAGDQAPVPYDAKKVSAYMKGDLSAVTDEAFREILGHEIPDGSWSGSLTKNDAICQLSYAKSGLARFVFKQLEKKKKKADEAGKPDLNILFIYNMPFRAIAKMTGGAVDRKMVDGIVKIVNGHFFGGLGNVITGYFGNGRKNKKYEKTLAGK